MAKLFSLTAPPPKVVLLPDAHFFVRTIPVPEAKTIADVTAQAELALEALAPFPLAQMNHGTFWKPGAAHALVFAAYRKRFTSEQISEWDGAEIVLPQFAAYAAAKVKPGSTIVCQSATAITVIHWKNPDDVPTTVITRTLAEDADERARQTLRDSLLAQLDGSKTIIDVAEAPVADREGDDSELGFLSGELRADYTREQLDSMDVRDKDDLLQRKRARSRDLLLWRIFIGSAAVMALAALLELTMIGGGFWQKKRIARVQSQAPAVAEINSSNALASRIEDLSSKRLRYFEMMDVVYSKLPPSIYFKRVSSDGPNHLSIEAETAVSSDLTTYRTALNSINGLHVDVPSQGSRNGVMNFTLDVVFSQEALNPPPTPTADATVPAPTPAPVAAKEGGKNS